MWIGIISLFPKMFDAITNYGITSKAIKNKIIKIDVWNPRDLTKNSYHTVDAPPYGGGPGMLMMAQPLFDTLKKLQNLLGKEAKIIYLSPQGRQLNYTNIKELIKNKKLILICGRYEGIDERLIQNKIDEEWSIGDYVLSGGELPAMVLIDSISRLIPGVLGHKKSAAQDSFTNGLLDYPQYTRPKILQELGEVPKVLMSGNHAEIDRWRMKQSLGRTWFRRPDLIKKINFNEEQMILITEFIMEKTIHLLNLKDKI